MTFQTLTQARKHLTNKGLREVHLRALAKVKHIRGQEFELIEIIQEVDDKKVYRFAGFNSLFNYCVQALELSEHQACEYIAVARKAKVFPELKKAVKNQEISVTKARRVAAVITPETGEQWLKIAKTSSKRQLEKAIAGQSPRAVYHESSRYVSRDLLQLQILVDEETLELIKRAQDLLSKGTPMPMGQAVKEVFGEFVEKHCPVKKAERAQKKSQAKQERPKQPTVASKLSGPGQTELPVRSENSQPGPGQTRMRTARIAARRSSQSVARGVIRRIYSRALIHQILLRDQGQCTYHNPSGQRCPERRWLEIHHIKPVSQGGTNDLKNLKLLCRGHHQLTHSPFKC